VKRSRRAPKSRLNQPGASLAGLEKEEKVMADLGPAGVTLVAFIASVLGLVGIFNMTGRATRSTVSRDLRQR
jgi:hypothetical protein